MKIEVTEEEAKFLQYLHNHYYYGMFKRTELIRSEEDECNFRDLLSSLVEKIEK